MSVEQKSLEDCCNHLINGCLVAFPTETVYGLGANAFDEKAIEKIYLAKDRPKTDPIIIHISNFNEIYDLVDLSEQEFVVVKRITSIFWPGPLTLILKASEKIPNLVTANSGLVGIRIPDHPLALNLIRDSKLPIAAPSANKFEHISSVKSSHVLDEFCNNHCLSESIFVLNDSECKNKLNIESTIVKLNFDKKNFEILRPGYITKEDLISLGIDNYQVIETVEYKNKDDILDSSGQLIKHYSINCNTKMIKTNRSINKDDISFAGNLAIIDINNLCEGFKDDLKYYDNLSENNDLIEMYQNYYDKLRIFENFSKSNDIDTLYIIVQENFKEKVLIEKHNSLVDRIFRTSSGNVINIT